MKNIVFKKTNSVPVLANIRRLFYDAGPAFIRIPASGINKSLAFTNGNLYHINNRSRQINIGAMFICRAYVFIHDASLLIFMRWLYIDLILAATSNPLLLISPALLFGSNDGKVINKEGFFINTWRTLLNKCSNRINSEPLFGGKRENSFIIPYSTFKLNDYVKSNY